MSTSPLATAPDTAPDGGWGVRNQALWQRTAAVAGRLNRAQAELVDIIDEVMTDRHWGEGGFKSPEHYLVVRAGLSHAHAADIVAVARRRTELTDAAVALEAGEMSLDQVAVLARHVPVTHQASVTQFARNATVTQLRRAVARHAFAAPEPMAETGEAADEAESAAERRACAKPDLAMSYDADGRFQLRYSAPATIGALVEQAVKEAKDALFLRRRDTDSGDASDPTRTGRAAPVDDRYAGLPTYADALEEMATRSLAAVTSTSRSAHYRVYLHLDTTGAWVNGGHAIPLRLLGRFISDGQVQPVWETEGRPVSVGRAMRILPHRTRRLITDRDRGCRFPGCPTTGFVEVHHLQAWADGGATDTDNQISLCTTHHDGIDRGDYTITGDPTVPDGLTVTNRYGLPIRPPRPHETAPPPDGDPPVPAGTYQPPSGGPISWNDLALTSDHEATHGTPPPPGLSLAPPPAAQTISWLNDPDNPDRGLIRTNWGNH
ncbi:HNH endonuclease signature motif containing protein [Pedococcus soli]